MSYADVEYENPHLNWLSKHAVELLIGITLMFMVWQSKVLLEVKETTTINSIRIEHLNEGVEDVNKAVNNVGKNEKTLRQLVEETSRDVGILKILAEIPYPDE